MGRNDYLGYYFDVFRIKFCHLHNFSTNESAHRFLDPTRLLEFVLQHHIYDSYQEILAKGPIADMY